MLQNIIKSNGKKYMNVKSAAKLWNLSSSTVRDYCRNGIVLDCIKLNNRKWYINIDEIKPLNKEQIHQLLVLTIQLKNDPTLEIDWNVVDVNKARIKETYQHLYSLGYIKEFSIEDDKRFPYEIILTQKGLEIATSFSKEENREYSIILDKWIRIMLEIGSSLIKAALIK